MDLEVISTILTGMSLMILSMDLEVGRLLGLCRDNARSVDHGIVSICA